MAAKTAAGVPLDDETADVRRRLLIALRAEGTAERAAQEKRYQKSRWEHWGVALPAMDAVLRSTCAGLSGAQRLALARSLWPEPVWDLRIVAGRMLVNKSVAADADLWRFVTERMADLDGWAVADTLAPVASRCLLADEARLDEVDAWVADPHLWTRRAALVFTLAWSKGGRNPDRMLAWAARLTPDREWFIQKAIGWWLRELSKRDPSRVRAFLDEHGAAMKAFARKEAEKYLDSPTNLKAASR